MMTSTLHRGDVVIETHQYRTLTGISESVVVRGALTGIVLVMLSLGMTGSFVFVGVLSTYYSIDDLFRWFLAPAILLVWVVLSLFSLTQLDKRMNRYVGCVICRRKRE